MNLDSGINWVLVTKPPKTKQKTLPIRYIQALISGFIKIIISLKYEGNIST